MAIIPMQKVRMMVHREELERVLDVVQHEGVVEFHEVEGENLALFGEDDRQRYHTLSTGIDDALAFLRPYGDKSARALAEEPLANEDCERLVKELEEGSLLGEVGIIEEESRAAQHEARILSEHYSLFLPWVKLPYSIPDDLRTARTVTRLYVVGALYLKEIENKVKAMGASVFVVGPERLATTLHVGQEESITEALKAYDMEEVILPVTEGTVKQALDETKKKITKSKHTIIALDKKVRELAKNALPILLRANDIVMWRRDKAELLAGTRGTAKVAIFEGWTPSAKIETLERALDRYRGSVAIVAIAPNEGEEPPVEIANGSMVTPFEAVTRLYGLPGYNDIDPTVYLMIPFAIAFGFALTDLGYGIFLVLLAAVSLHFLKDPSVRGYLITLGVGGASAILFGIITGGYLGIDIGYLPAFLQKAALFDLIKNPLPVFYLSLAVGVLQIMFGMVLRIVREAKNKNLVGGVLDQGPWLLLFLAGIWYGFARFGYGESFREPALWSIYVSLALIVLGGVLLGKSVAGRIGKGLGGLYKGVGYFSDILSFSRLFAFGLATSALSFSVNLIAVLLIDMIPYVGYVAAAFVLIVGHVFNLAVNTLGAFIHGARLQFVEFFGKFIDESGRVFRPLTRKSVYVVVRDSRSGLV